MLPPRHAQARPPASPAAGNRLIGIVSVIMSPLWINLFSDLYTFNITKMLRKAQENFLFFFCNIPDLRIVYIGQNGNERPQKKFLKRLQHFTVLIVSIANGKNTQAMKRKIIYEKDDLYDDGTGGSMAAYGGKRCPMVIARLPNTQSQQAQMKIVIKGQTTSLQTISVNGCTMVRSARLQRRLGYRQVGRSKEGDQPQH